MKKPLMVISVVFLLGFAFSCQQGEEAKLNLPLAGD